MKRVYLLIVLAATAYGCQNILGPDPADTPQGNAEIFWTDFDHFYAQFEVRHVNWDSVHVGLSSQITSEATDGQLFSALASAVRELNDLHVTLFTPLGDVYAGDLSRGRYPSNRLINAGKYLVSGPAQSGVFEYRMCKGQHVGYISIKTFQGGGGVSLRDDRYLAIDDILRQFVNTDGLVIDVRGNSGGNSVNAETVAGRFADRERVYWKYRSKNGPGKNDFSEWREVSLGRKGPNQYRRPVVVLTSRATCSSAELFVAAMRQYPQVTIVGDTTAGGVGNPIFRELPNGWTYRLSTAIAATADGEIIEERGIPPDIAIQTSIADSLGGIDRILERGVEVVRNAQNPTAKASAMTSASTDPASRQAVAKDPSQGSGAGNSFL